MPRLAKHVEGGAKALCRRWDKGGAIWGMGSHLQFSARYCTTLSRTFSMSAVRTHICFKACGLRAEAFPLAEPCLRKASWLPPEGFLQSREGLQECECLGVNSMAMAIRTETNATR